MKKTRIGAVEEVTIPEWGLRRIRAKIDTGAFTSSLDVGDVHVLPSEPNRPRYAEILLRDGTRERTVRVPVTRFRRVRNPSGGVTNRPIVELVISLAGRRFRTSVNLHRRDGMNYRMIIGRRALLGRFVVDVSLGREKTPVKTDASG